MEQTAIKIPKHKNSDSPKSVEGTVCVVCNGCPENRIDSASVQKCLKLNGWEILENWKNADLILLNACGLTGNLANDTLNIIKEIETEKKKGAKLFVWGCLTKIDPIALRNVFEGKTFKEAEDLLEELLGSDSDMATVKGNRILPEIQLSKNIRKNFLSYNGSIPTKIIKHIAVKWDTIVKSRINLIRENDPSIFYIKIASGCLSQCAYCGIKKSRGTIKSIPINEVITQFKEGLQKKFDKFSLLGTDLGAYGMDLGYNLMDLLKALIQLEGDFKIGLRNVNPSHLTKMIKDFIPILQSKKIWYIEIPVESGSNRLLKLMNRDYTIEEYKNCVETIRKICPKILIRTQILVGFPTETQQDIADTIQLLDDVVFDYIEVYRYSDRPGTIASQLKHKIPSQEKEKRFLKVYKNAQFNRPKLKIKNLILHRKKSS